MEIGVPKYPSLCFLFFLIAADSSSTSAGALIMLRPLPSLCFEIPDSLLYLPEDFDSGSAQSSTFVLFERGAAKQRYLRACRRQVSGHQPLASVKQVYGAVFSGYRAWMRNKEERVISLLVAVAESLELPPCKPMSTKYQSLHSAAVTVLAALKDAIGKEVEEHLKHFSTKLLKSETVLQWSLSTNSCQDFTNNLMHGDFEGLYPRMPRDLLPCNNQVEVSNLPWSSHLFCLKNAIDSPQIGLRGTQCRSIVWQFYEWSRNKCDMIEYIERKIDQDLPNSHTSWEVLLLQHPGSQDTNSTTSVVQESVLVDALWYLPRNTASVLQTHLSRPREKYSNPTGHVLGRAEWVLNRLRILQQLDIFATLSGGLGAAWLARFEKHPEDLRKLIFPDSDMYGTLCADEKLITIQLGPLETSFAKGRRSKDWKHIARRLVKYSRTTNRLKVAFQGWI